jgi:ribosome-associated protein
MLFISHNVSIPDQEIDMQAIRAQGPGGQNVNKVSSAIHLRFDIKSSSLPSYYKEKLLALSDYRITKDGVIIIKAQEYKSQEMNRQVAQERLIALIKQAITVQKTRRPTKPSRSSKQKRMNKKTKRGQTKVLRGKIEY